MKLKIAGVGAGYFAQFHYEAWNRIKNIDLVGICDLDFRKAKKTSETHKITNYFNLRTSGFSI